MNGRGARSKDCVRSPDQLAFLSIEETKRLKTMVEQDSLAAKETGASYFTSSLNRSSPTTTESGCSL